MDYGSGDALFGMSFGLVMLFILVWFYVGLPAGMAIKRGRSAVFWVLVSLFLSPLTAIVLLLLLGRSWTAR